MAVTAKGTPYVESSDLVANYPGVSLALANHIDTLGKVLQVVRATDSTLRTTTSASYVDVTGMSVTITPTSATSTLMIVAICRNQTDAASCFVDTRITDSSNNALSGTERSQFGGGANSLATVSITGFVAPASTAALTYKLRFAKSGGGGTTATIGNDSITGQMYAYEVSA